MRSSSLFVTLVTFGLSGLGESRPNTRSAQVCPNSNWPNWSGIKHAFVFGDSYTQTGFNNTLGPQPSLGNPMGNPPYPGFTSSNGPNWIDFLTVQYNASALLTYNLAFGGATVDSSLVAPFEPTVLSVADQVLDEFFPTYASSPAIAPWKSTDTLFAVFIGINDVGNSYFEGVPATTTLNTEIFNVYSGLVQMLYNSGARNFLFLNVPPVDRSPLTVGEGASAAALQKADLAAFNADIVNMATQLKKTHTDTNVFTFDTNTLFTQVLNNPASFPQTSIYKNTTNFCVAYENGTPANNTFDASCGVPVNEYFWLNSLHPTYPMHQVLAQQLSLALAKGPNIC